MIFLDSYKTTTGSIFVTKPIENSIQEAIIKDRLDNSNLSVIPTGEVKPVFITGYTSSEANIPLFTHPITILDSQKNHYLCTDLRMYLRKDIDIDNIEASIKNRTEYNFAKSRAILNLIWLNDGPDTIKHELVFASNVYSAWLADILSKTYALDYQDQTTLQLAFSYFYQTLFFNGDIDEHVKQRMAVHTMKSTGATSDMVFQVFDGLGTPSNMEDFLTQLVGLMDNIRLKDLNLPMLLTIIKNSWYGTNSKEIISVALEHPPTWIAVVFAGLSERTFKNSMVARVAERFGKKGKADAFLTAYKSMVTANLRAGTEDIAVREFED